MRVSSIVSRVVPAISETIARSSFNNVFNKVDFPALGLPTIAVFTPFLIAFPNLKDKANLVTKSDTVLTKVTNSVRSANSTSSSAKSNSNSISEAK